MESKDSQIKHASMADLSAIHQLCFQLGYEPTLENSRKGLETVLNHPDYEVVVIAQDSDVLG
jgi:N-acetylglutamate synthase-like GNAT family acetyltransferase